MRLSWPQYIAIEIPLLNLFGAMTENGPTRGNQIKRSIRFGQLRLSKAVGLLGHLGRSQCLPLEELPIVLHRPELEKPSCRGPKATGLEPS